MKRRLFSALLGSAPLAAPAVVKGFDERNNPMVEQYPGVPVNPYVPSPLELLRQENRKKFYAARELVDRQHHNFMYRPDNMFPNIDVLRSVSHQHKINMHKDAVRKHEEEHKSSVQKLMEMFGINDRDEPDYLRAGSSLGRY